MLVHIGQATLRNLNIILKLCQISTTFEIDNINWSFLDIFRESWREHLFEINIPSSITVGHFDLNFALRNERTSVEIGVRESSYFH